MSKLKILDFFYLCTLQTSCKFHISLAYASSAYTTHVSSCRNESYLKQEGLGQRISPTAAAFPGWSHAMEAISRLPWLVNQHITWKKTQLKQEATCLKNNCCNCCWMQGLFEYFHSVVIFTTGWWGSRKLSMVSPLNRIHIQKEEWVPRDEIEFRSFVVSTVGWWTSFSQ